MGQRSKDACRAGFSSQSNSSEKTATVPNQLITNSMRPAVSPIQLCQRNQVRRAVNVALLEANAIRKAQASTLFAIVEGTECASGLVGHVDVIGIQQIGDSERE